MAIRRNSESTSIKELRQSEARLKQAVKAGNVGLWDWDLQTNRVYYSPEWKRQIGYEEHEISDDFSEWQSRVHPDDLSATLQAVREFIEKTRSAYSVEFRFRHKDGSYRWIWAQGSLQYGAGDRPERMLGSHVDITGRKQVENELRKVHDQLLQQSKQRSTEHQRLFDVIETLPVMVCLMTPDYHVRFANSAFRQKFGESNGRRCYEYCCGYDKPCPFCESFVPLKTGQPHHWEFTSPDGSIIIDAYDFPFTDSDGSPLILEMDIDITEKRQYELALRESEAKARAIFDLSFQFIGLLTLDGTLIEVNKSALVFAGVQQSDVLGKPFWETPWWTHSPELQARLRQAIQDAARGQMVRFEVTHSSVDGTLHTIDFSLKPVKDETDKVVLIIPEGRDITERKEMEEALRRSHEELESKVRERTAELARANKLLVADITEREKAEQERDRILEMSSDLICIAGMDGYFKYVNPAWTRVLGYARDRLLSEPFLNFIHPDDHRKNNKEVDSIASGHLTAAFENRYIHEDGTIRVIEWKATPLPDKKLMYCVGRDITERKQAEEDRKRAEEERERLQAQLQQSQKMEAVGRLSGGIAHDFNNLLTVIQGSVEIASLTLDAGLNEQRADNVATALEEIQQAAERAANLTSQLLTFSRKHVAHVDVVDVGNLIHNSEKMVRRLTREDIAFELAISPGKHLIKADKTQLEQVLVNLVINASDAMPNGGKLSIQAREVYLDETNAQNHINAKRGSHILISVADTGIGMDANTLDHLFEPFFTTKPYGKGTGLGLSIVYGIVKQSDGHIGVESTLGKGSTFDLYFPAAQEEIVKSVEPTQTEWKGGNETILLCEDEVSLRRMAADILTRSGYTVIEAENGEQAVQLAENYAGAFQLLITDVVMPGMKGDKVASAILKNQPDVRVLFMSGYTSDVLSVERISKSGLEFLQKPFKPQALLRRVREILKRMKK